MSLDKIPFHNYFSALKELCFPPVCASCKIGLPASTKVHLCPDCLKSLYLITDHYCHCCGLPYSNKNIDSHLCSTCIGPSPYKFNKARSLLLYDKNIASLITSFKYGKRTTTLPVFRYLWDQSGLELFFQDADIIVPVPLHLKRLRSRGFNQALLLAEVFFSDQLKKIDPYILERKHNTRQQTGLKGKERRANLKNAFKVKNQASVRAKKIILVDDVFTTGTTLNECAKILLKNGAKEIMALTLARANDPQ